MWKGNYGNQPLPDGLYSWRATGTFSNGKTFDLQGNVKLVRVAQQKFDEY
ncbi:MAG: hypothetical protein HC896_03200 [Bacteroidales bacterium]|nr:hypothetical protein [Bacteroidales bacterium]